MSNGNGHSWSKFWWRDWAGDKALHSCGIGTRGFWMEMLCIMHEGSPVGYLTINGKPATLRQMAASANVTEKDAKRFLVELEEAGVFSRAPDGGIYSRRMVRDAAASEAGRESVAKRWNGAKPPPDPNRDPNRDPNSPPNRDPNREAYRGAYRDPNSPPISPSFPLDSLSSPPEAEKLRSRPPPAPPVSRGGRARPPHRNGFVELERRLNAAANPLTIEASAEEMAEIHEFSARLKLVSGGSNG